MPSGYQKHYNCHEYSAYRHTQKQSSVWRDLEWALRNGGPNRGGPGRPPNEFKARMRELASSDEALRYLEECVDGVHTPIVAIAAHRHVTERGYGKVPMEAPATVDHPILIVSSLEELEGRLEREADEERLIGSGADRPGRPEE